MSDPKMIKEIKAAVTIPVMAKVRIGHFVEAQVRLCALHTDARERESVCVCACVRVCVCLCVCTNMHTHRGSLVDWRLVDSASLCP